MSCLWYCPLCFRGVFVSELNERECDKAISASDLEKYYQEFEGGNYQYDVNQARVEALDYVMDYRQRLGISVSSYFRVSGERSMCS